MSSSPIKRRALKILGQLQDFNAQAMSDERRKSIEQTINDRVIGCYFNRNKALPDIVVGERAIHLCHVEKMSSSQTISYREIVEVSVPDRENKNTQQLVLRLMDGGNTVVPILGHHGKFYDSYEFARFLIDVTSSRPSGNEEREA